MREAALPSAGYASPDNHFLSDGRIIVRVYPEAGRGFKDFSFHALNVAPELQTLFAEGFALATGPSGTRRTIPSAANLFAGIGTFVRLIASSPRPPARTAELRPVHLAELRMRHTASAISALHALRVVLRSNSEVPVPFRNALFAPLPSSRRSTLSVSYTKAEFRSVQRAARSDIRAALRRIRAGEDELGSWRQEHGQVSDIWERAQVPERRWDRGGRSTSSGFVRRRSSLHVWCIARSQLHTWSNGGLQLTLPHRFRGGGAGRAVPVPDRAEPVHDL